MNLKRCGRKWLWPDLKKLSWNSLRNNEGNPVNSPVRIGGVYQPRF
jgi:hypothetical protein